MTIDVLGLAALSVTLCVHLVVTVWWAASLTRRVDHIEKWIESHGQTGERLAAMEQQIAWLRGGIRRIEHHLRYNM